MLGRTSTLSGTTMATHIQMATCMLYQRFGLRPTRIGKHQKLTPLPGTLPGRCTRFLSAILRLVQRRAPTLRHRLHDPSQHPLRHGTGHPCHSASHPGRSLPGPPEPLQGQAAAAPSPPDRGMDQPTEGIKQPQYHPTPHTKLVPPRAAKSLTRSAGARDGATAGHRHAVLRIT